MVKAAVSKPKGDAGKKKKNIEVKNAKKKESNVVENAGNLKVKPGTKPLKPKHVGSPNKKQLKEKKTKKKVVASEESDENTEHISSEVSELLSQLRQEHGLPEDPNLSTIVHASPVKEKPNKKNKNKAKVDAAALKLAQTSPKQANKKKVFVEGNADGSVAAAPSPKNIDGKKKKNKKNNVASIIVGKQNAQPAQKQAEKADKKQKKQNKKRPAEENTSEESPAKVAKLNDGQKSPKKPKKKKGNKAVAKDDSATKPEDVKETPEKKEPVINKKTNKPFKAVPIFNVEGSSSIYIGNLPLSVRRKKIVKECLKYGEVLSVRILTNTGDRIYYKHSYDKIKEVKGDPPFLIAFVCFKNEEAAKKALALNGKKIDNNILTVSMDRTNGVEKPKYEPKRTIFVGNLPYEANDAALREAFECCGEIDYVRLLQCSKGCKGTAYVCFKGAESVDLALKLNKTKVCNREINVERYHTKKLGAGAAKAEQSKGAVRRIKNQDGKKGENRQTYEKKKNKNFIGAKADKKKKNNKNNKKQKPLAGNKLLAKTIAPKKVKETPVEG